MLVILFQLVQVRYERGGWNFHHDQQLEFEEPAADSSPEITLHFNEESSADDKWKIVPLGPPKVRSFLSPVHWYCPNVQYRHVLNFFHQIMKDKVDVMGEKSRPPRCRLALKWTGKPKRRFPTVSRRVDLEGAKRPYHYFTITLPETGSVYCYKTNDNSNCDTFASKAVCCKGVDQSGFFGNAFLQYQAKVPYLPQFDTYCVV